MFLKKQDVTPDSLQVLRDKDVRCLVEQRTLDEGDR